MLGRGKAKAKRKKAIDHGRKTEAGRLEAFIYAIGSLRPNSLAFAGMKQKTMENVIKHCWLPFTRAHFRRAESTFIAHE